MLLALPIFKARKSRIEYTLAKVVPGAGVGVIAAIVDAMEIIPVTIPNHDCACSSVIRSVICLFCLFLFLRINVIAQFYLYILPNSFDNM